MKKLILWAMELKWDRYYVYCTASGRPEVGNGNQVSNYLRSFGNNPSVDLITYPGFKDKAKADAYARSLRGRCPKK